MAPHGLIRPELDAKLTGYMSERRECVDCRKVSPETSTDYTLISAKFGWRLTRIQTAEGNYGLEWRCPSCWAEYKKAKGGPASPLGPARPRTPR